MIITPSLVANALSLLSAPADGTNANTQAREQADSILTNHIESLRLFIARNPDSQCAKSMIETIKRIETIKGGR